MAGSSAVERSLKLILDDKGVNCRLRIDPGFDPGELDVGSAMAFLDARGVVRTLIERDAVSSLINSAQAEPQKPHETFVAQGTQPRPGQDAKFEFSPDIAQQFEKIEQRAEALRKAPAPKPGGSGDVPADSPVDFYNVSAFVIVRRSARIGRIRPATAGVPGTDVHGDPIEAQNGKDLALKIGEGLQLNEENEVVADVDGRLVHEKNEIRVEETLRVEGNVDFSTGNIDFPGDVDILAGVRDRFKVASAGSVHVKDLVEAADLAVEHDLTFSTGMAGRDIGTLHVGGALRARYLDGVTGTVDGPCVVDREINNCDLTLRATFESPGCVIRGGTVSVSKRIDTGELGGRGGVHTILRLGWVPELEEISRELLTLGESLLAEVAHRPAARGTIYTLGRPLGKAAAAWRRVAIVSLTVRRGIHPGVTVVLPGWTAVFKSFLKGPVIIDLGPDHIPRCGPLGSENPVHLSKFAEVERSGEIVDLAGLAHRLGVDLAA